MYIRIGPVRRGSGAGAVIVVMVVFSGDQQLQRMALAPLAARLMSPHLTICIPRVPRSSPCTLTVSSHPTKSLKIIIIIKINKMMKKKKEWVHGFIG